MPSWKIISFFVLLLFLQTNGNPISEKEGISEVVNQPEDSKLLQHLRSRRNTPCYYLDPTFDLSNPLFFDNYLFTLRSGRCRNFSDPKQKYTTWDLV